MDPETQQELLEKVGSRYKLVSLVQKRMRELVRGLPPLAEGDPQDPWDLVVNEILGDKVQLVTGEEAEKIRKELMGREGEEAAALPGKHGAAQAAEKKK
jgi:DNA-directed RNA polymerase subunit K/omega